MESLNLSDSVIFGGFKTNVQEYMFAMDAFVFPSKFEGLGIVLIEAQASGLNSYTSKYVVPDEAKVSHLLEYISLDEKPEIWAEKIIQKLFNRENVYDEIKEKGYDIKDTAKLLEDFYIRSEKSDEKEI